ncbi:SGNH hydrolase [Ascobolus immersus RN42]|uniref:SGNH hydrolase n=1 Tax=Ascobolus immersus RN42 TaxID=1160509 RepID=A0A3N4HRD9_ASCIM|nr:SGNH hydrolase [Ascobolus immersus RN42]
MKIQLTFFSLLAPCVVYAQTVYLCGDSTMANRGANDGATDGWGPYLGAMITLPVVNKAIGGRSARSFTREGRFTEVANLVKSGDYVVIEFGHNDGGGLGSGDNGRTPCGGSGEEKCQVTYNGQPETVLTYWAYLRNAANLLKSKGANVIISSPTPNNVWEGGSWQYSPSRFTTMSQDAARATGSTFVDHGTYYANLMKLVGKDTTNSWFPRDHTHTSPAGAKGAAESFVKALTCDTTGGLKSKVNSSGYGLRGTCANGSQPSQGGSSGTTTSSTPAPTGGAGGSLPKYSQCAGAQWTGSGTCVAGTTCNKINDWYSQCL